MSQAFQPSLDFAAAAVAAEDEPRAPEDEPVPGLRLAASE